jgi:hypothetical protein
MSDVGEGAVELLPCANMNLRMNTRSQIWGRFGGGSARNSALLGNGCNPMRDMQIVQSPINTGDFASG